MHTNDHEAFFPTNIYDLQKALAIQLQVAHFDILVYDLVCMKFADAYDEMRDDESCMLLAQALFGLLIFSDLRAF